MAGFHPDERGRGRAVHAPFEAHGRVETEGTGSGRREVRVSVNLAPTPRRIRCPGRDIRPLHHPRVSVSRPDQRGLSSASGTPRAPSGLTGLTVTGPVPSLPFSPSLAADAAETLPNPRAT